MTAPRQRIARIITRLNIGGPAIQAIDLTRELRAFGFDTRLIHGHLAEGEGDMRSIMPMPQSSDASALYVGALVRPISPFKDLTAFWRLYRALCEWQPAVVHTHMAKAGSVGRLAAIAYNTWGRKGERARLLHTYHGHVFDGYFKSLSTQVFLAVERWLARRTDALIAISPQIRTDLITTYHVAASEEQVRIIPLGFNLDRFAGVDDDVRTRARASLGVPSDAITVTTVGRLTAIKQHTLFLDMAALLLAKSRRYLFLIVGDGELRADLEARAATLGIADRVRFLGWRGDLDVVYGATDVFALTSRNEGTPVALIEAMASGVASISTDVGGVRDVVTSPELGSLAPFGDAQALADAAAAYADDADRRRAAGIAARASVCGRYHASRLRNEIQTLYWQLLEKGGTISSRPPA